MQARRLEVLARLVPPLVHDLNNVLAVVAGESDLVASGEPGFSAAEYASRVAEQTTRSARALGALSVLAQARPEPRPAPEAVPFDGPRLVEEAELLLGPYARHRGVGLELVRGPAVVRADQRRVLQGLVVLAVAAIGPEREPGPEPGREARPRVRIALRARGARAFLRVVSDTGARVEAVDVAALRAAAGAAGGDVRERGRGGAWGLEVRLPAVAGAAATSPPPAGERAPAASVVLVEADELLADLVSTVLTESGYRVRRAPDLEAARDALADCDLLVLDRELAPERLGAIPCRVALLSNPRGGAPGDPGVPSLSKPFRPSELVGFVERCLRS